MFLISRKFLIMPLLALMALMPLITFANQVPFAEPLSQVAWNACQTIKTLSKDNFVNSYFVSNFHIFAISQTEDTTYANSKYVAIATQYPFSDDGSSSFIRFWLDTHGNSIHQDIGDFLPSPSAPNWSKFDPVTLSQIALKYIYIHSTEEAALNDYNINFNSLVINQVLKANGTKLAQVLIGSQKVKKTLEFIIDLDGKIQSHQFID